MSAREVMARAQADYWDNPDIPEAYWPMVDAQLAALTAAGFRIVEPDEAREADLRDFVEGIRKTWRVADDNLSYSDAINLMNKKLGRVEFEPIK